MTVMYTNSRDNDAHGLVVKAKHLLHGLNISYVAFSNMELG